MAIKPPPLRLRPYQPGDYGTFTPRADFAEEHAAMGLPLAGVGQPPGSAWTLLRGDTEVIGCGGVIDAGHGDFLAWGCAGRLAPREWWQALHLARTVLEHARRMGALVIFADARADRPAAARCLRALGFAPFCRRAEHPRLPGVAYDRMIRSA